MSTDESRRRQPNQRLTWERLKRGWSREELVRQIALSMRAHGETDTGLTADTARRWECGERWPEPRFRKHLVLLFGLPASDLGLLTTEELALRPELTPALTAAGAVPNEFVEGMRRLLLDPGEGTRLGRQGFLRAMLAAGLTPLVEWSTIDEVDAAWRTPGASCDPRAVAAYGRITTTQRDLYWTTEPGALLDSVLSHLRLGLGLLSTSASDSRLDHAIATAVAETALLAARLTLFDLGLPGLASRCFDHAESAVERSGDHALAAAVAAHRAFVPGFAGNPVAAQHYLDAARAHVRYTDGPVLRSWLHCVAAELDARTGQPKLAKDRIRQAEDALGGNGSDPEWLDYFDAARLAGFAGNAELLAGRHSSAVRWLTQAVDQLDANSTKQRAVLLFDLAAAHAPADPEQAAEIAHDACSILETTFYRTAFDRIAALQLTLEGTPGGAELAERADHLRALVAGS